MISFLSLSIWTCEPDVRQFKLTRRLLKVEANLCSLISKIAVLSCLKVSVEQEDFVEEERNNVARAKESEVDGLPQGELCNNGHELSDTAEPLGDEHNEETVCEMFPGHSVVFGRPLGGHGKAEDTGEAEAQNDEQADVRAETYHILVQSIVVA